MKIHKEKTKKVIVIENQYDSKEIRDVISSLNSSLFELQRKSGEEKANVKTIVLDWNNLEQVDKICRSLIGRKQQLKKDKGLLSEDTQTNLFQSRWDAIQTILNTDISFLYENSNLNQETKFYVYAHCDTTKEIKIKKTTAVQAYAASLGMKSMPFYIGKGTGNRYEKSGRNGYHTKITNKKLNNTERIILKNNLSESEALQLESKLIDIFGLTVYGGYLINIDEGLQSEHRKFLYKDSLTVLRKIEESL